MKLEHYYECELTANLRVAFYRVVFGRGVKQILAGTLLFTALLVVLVGLSFAFAFLP